MDLAAIYESVKERLARIDFKKLWEGFHPFRFALYNETECVFDGQRIEKPAGFIANTAVEYMGELIAIWNVIEAPGDMDAFCASIAHEMFHAFQRESGESRWPDENEALMRYEYSEENIAGRLAEAGLMREIIGTGGGEAYKRLVGIMRKRADDFPFEFDYEARIAEIEGSACFTELAALEQLDPRKAEKRWGKLLDDISDPAKYAPARIISYSTGAALIRCMRTFRDNACFGAGPVPFAVKLIENARPANEAFVPDPRIRRVVRDFAEKTRETVENAIGKNDVLLEGRYPLVSLNVYDARRYGSCVVSTYFIAYSDGGETRIIQGDVVAELDEENNILKVYRK